MKTSPILEEVWKTKDDLARESGYDIHRFFEDLRHWAREHPHSGRVARDIHELQRLLADEEQKNASNALALKDKLPSGRS